MFSTTCVLYVLCYICPLLPVFSSNFVLLCMCPTLHMFSATYFLYYLFSPCFFYYPCPLYTCVHYYLCPLYTCVHYNLCPLYTCGMSSIFLPMNSGNVDERMLMSLKYNILDYLYFPHVSVNLLFF